MEEAPAPAPAPAPDKPAESAPEGSPAPAAESSAASPPADGDKTEKPADDATTDKPAAVIGPAPAPAPHLQFASLYVGDLHPDVTEAILHEAFNTAGNVASCRICRDGATRRSLFYGYVNYYVVEDAERALDTLNYSLIKGRPCRVMWSMRDNAARRSTKNNIFVRNLDPSIDNRTLHDTFSIFGNILSCKVATDTNGRSKGHGFIHFEGEEAAKLAIDRVNGMEIAGCKVFVGPFMKREELEASGLDEYTNLYVKHMPKAWDEKKLTDMFSEFGQVASAVIMSSNDDKQFALVNFREPSSAADAVMALHRKNMAEELSVEERLAIGLSESGEVVAKEKKEDAAESAPEKENAQDAAVAETCESESKTEAETERKPATRCKPEDSTDVPSHLLYVQRAQTRSERKADMEKERERRKGERPPGVRLCVRNLLDTATSDQLRKLFEPFGTVLSAIVRSDEETGKCRGFGFVVMSSIDQATAAVSEMHLKVVDGKALNVGLAEKRNGKKGPEEGDDAGAEKSKTRKGDGDSKGGGKGGGKGGDGKANASPRKKGSDGKGKGGGKKQVTGPPAPPVPPFGVPPGARFPGVPPNFPLGVPPPFGYPPPFGMPYGMQGPPGRLPMPGAPLPPGVPPYVGMPPPHPGMPPPHGAPFAGPPGAVHSLPPAILAPGSAGAPMPPAFLGWPPHMQPPSTPGGFRPPMPGAFPSSPGHQQAHAHAQAVAAHQAAMAAAVARPPVAPLQPTAVGSGGPPPGVIPIDVQALAALPPRQQKQQLGERLFPIVREYQPANAGKVTGMILELPNEEILRLLQSDGHLKKKINEACTVLDK